MKCTIHPEADAVGYCRNCGKALCSTCVRQVRDIFYCEDCLAQTLGHGVPAGAGASIPPDSPSRQSSGNSAVAFILGFLFPGLGAVYNGEYSKALIHIVVFATFILGLSSDIEGGMKAVLGILLAGFIFYMAFDAMRVAKAKESGAVPADPFEGFGRGRPIGPIILIAVGALLLLNNFDWFPWYRIQQFWPLILIVVGLLMFRNRLERRPWRTHHE